MRTPSLSLRPALAAIATALLLTACGGGSGSDDDPSTGPPPLKPIAGAEGRWLGRASTGYDVLLTILEDGETWGIYTRGPGIQGAFHGSSSSGDGWVRGSAAHVDYERGAAVRSALYEGSFTRQRQMRVGFVFDTFSGSYAADYERPATRAAVVGSYTGVVGGWPLTRPMTLAVTADGQLLSTPPDAACLVRGSLAPRPGGRNVYDMRASFTGDHCPVPHLTQVAGIALLDGGSRLIITSVAPSAVDFFVFQGGR